jgi:multimeric flavodoxin WrbA
MKLLQKNYSTKQKILCIGGSPRKGGNTDSIMDRFVTSIPGSTPTEIIQLRDYEFNSCIGCERCRKDKYCSGQKDGMNLLYPKIIESQGMVLVSPTHHYNITAWMKAYIDRMYCFYDFGNEVPRSWSSQLSGQNRKAAIIAICEQENKKDMGFTLEAMRLPLEALGYEIIDELAVFKIFKRGGVKKHNQVLDRVIEIAEKMANSLNS